jgi:hypothetical protein
MVSGKSLNMFFPAQQLQNTQGEIVQVPSDLACIEELYTPITAGRGENLHLRYAILSVSSNLPSIDKSSSQHSTSPTQLIFRISLLIDRSLPWMRKEDRVDLVVFAIYNNI